MKKTINVVAGIIYNRHGHYLMARKKKELPIGGYWEFPGGKQENGETPLITLEREIREELGLELVNIQHVFSYKYVSEEIELLFEVCAAKCLSEKVLLNDHDAIEWVKPGDPPPKPLAAADHPIMEYLLKSEK
jgi:8-oxo-dGTP diphosphatase